MGSPIEPIGPTRNFTVDSRGSTHPRGPLDTTPGEWGKRLAEAEKNAERLMEKLRAAEDRSRRMEMENCMLKMQILTDGMLSKAPAPAVAGLDQEKIRELITLCHPDKHANSPVATRLTQW